MTESLSIIIAAHISMNGWSFYTRDAGLSADEVSGAGCLLPVVLWRAKKLHCIALGYDLEVNFAAVPQALMGVRSRVLDDALKSRAPTSLFCIEVLVQALEEHPAHDGASVEALIEEFLADMKRGLVPGVTGGSNAPTLAWMEAAPA